MCLVAQSCLTLCDPIDCSLPGSSMSMEFSRQEYWSGSKAPNRTARPTPNSLAPPHTHTLELQTGQICEPTRWVSSSEKEPGLNKQTRLRHNAPHRMLRKAYVHQGACAAMDAHAHTAHPLWVGPVQCPLRFSRHWGRLLEPQGLWRMRKGLEDYIFFLPLQSFVCIHKLWW